MKLQFKTVKGKASRFSFKLLVPDHWQFWQSSRSEWVGVRDSRVYKKITPKKTNFVVNTFQWSRISSSACAYALFSLAHFNILLYAILGTTFNKRDKAEI